MGKCCYLCDALPSKDAGVVLHKFPKNPLVRDKWLKACNLSSRDNVTHVYICSLHFHPHDIIKGNEFDSRVILRRGSVPSIDVPNPIVEIMEDNVNVPNPKGMSIKDTTIQHSTNSNTNTAEQNFVTSKEQVEESKETQIKVFTKKLIKNIKCVARGCTSESKKDFKTSFYKFPLNDPPLLERWLKVVDKDNWQATEESHLCSNHFWGTDFLDKEEGAKNRLNLDIVPTVFSVYKPSEVERGDTEMLGKTRKTPPPEIEKEGPSNEIGNNSSINIVNTQLNNCFNYINPNVATAFIKNVPIIQNITKENFSGICRCCMINKGAVNIFEVYFQQKPLSELICCCINEEVSKNDNLPKTVCAQCMQQVISCYMFIAKTKDMQTNIKEMEKSLFREDVLDIQSDEEIMEPVDLGFKEEFKTITKIYNELCEALVDNRRVLRKYVKMLENPLTNTNKPLTAVDEIRNDYESNDLISTEVNEDSSDLGYRITGKLTSIATFDTVDALLLDYKLETDDDIKCLECSLSFPSTSSLEKHCIEKNHFNAYKCDLCKKNFKTYKSYKSHVSIHNKSYKKLCEICGLLVTVTYMKQHRESHFPVRSTCNVCHKSFSTKSSLSWHYNTYHKYEDTVHLCSFCGKTYKLISMLNLHLNTTHRKENLGSCYLPCTKCPKFFVNERSLNLHNIYSHTDSTKYKQRRPKLNSNVKKKKITRR